MEIEDEALKISCCFSKQSWKKSDFYFLLILRINQRELGQRVLNNFEFLKGEEINFWV